MIVILTARQLAKSPIAKILTIKNILYIAKNERNTQATS